MLDVLEMQERIDSFQAQRDYLESLLFLAGANKPSGELDEVILSVASEFDYQRFLAISNLEAGADVVIDPIECIDLTPIVQAIGEGDWGDEALRIEQRYDDIYAKANLPESRKVRVVIFDTGKQVHSRLDDLRDDTHGKDWTNSSSDVDVHSHATHCAGIATGTDTEQLRSPIAEAGKLELAWQKVLGDNGSGSFTGIRNAIIHENEVSKQKIAEGYFVIYSFSLGGGSAIYQPVEEVLQAAQEIGVLTVASAGNSGSTMGYPGTSNYTLGIGSLQQGTPPTRSSFSAYGPKLWGTTPGSRILSTIPGDKFGYKSGTSMSCPYMAYVASIVACINPEAKWHDVLGHIVKYGTDLGAQGRDDFYGFGWPPIDKIIDNPAGSHPPPEPPPPAPVPKAPVQLQPKNGETVEVDPKIAWEKTEHATYYYVLFTDPDGRKAAYGTGSTSVLYRNQKQGAYKWQVRARNIDGVYGPYSPEWTFTIGSGTPAPTPAPVPTPAPEPSPTPSPVPAPVPTPTPPPEPTGPVFGLDVEEVIIAYSVKGDGQLMKLSLKLVGDPSKYEGDVVRDTVNFLVETDFRFGKEVDLVSATYSIIRAYNAFLEENYDSVRVSSAKAKDLITEVTLFLE